jgi:site-specific DNA-methyltransferase (adenine-specific)
MIKVNISQVKPNPKNPRVIRDGKFQKLVTSIKEFPDMLNKRPLIVFTDVDGKYCVLGGNMRLKACKEIGLKEIPIIIADEWTEEQKAEFLIKDNVGFGEWDWDQLANQWDTEKLQDWGLDLPLGFDEVLEAEEDDFDVPEGGIETDIVLGDLFEIGDHRLLCGDSTDNLAVEKLIGNEKISLIVTDPPYGLGISGQKESKAKNPKHNRKYHEDGGWDESIPDQSMFNYISMFDCDIIIWGGNYFSNFLENSRGWICWSKGQDGQLTMSDGELAWTNIDKPLRIVTVNRAALGKTVHPTQKPIEVILFSIKYSESIGTILDFYLGSGSTMIASHQLKRKCYGMELDPKYCQIIIDRMKKLDPTLIIKRNGITI